MSCLYRPPSFAPVAPSCVLCSLRRLLITSSYDLRGGYHGRRGRAYEKRSSSAGGAKSNVASMALSSSFSASSAVPMASGQCLVHMRFKNLPP
mmetsp:Transcript_11123/g.33340  ORF Transcript_11123/g.33340 Transcript_11123/m.33340 type:complete len:93 (-) Transcript_11123:1696-1974(-)